MDKKAIIEKLAKEVEQRNTRIAELKAALTKEERKKSDRQKYSWGGLVSLAVEVEKNEPDNETLLGGLLYVCRSAGRSDKTDMIASWKRAGSELLNSRIQKRNEKKVSAPALPLPSETEPK